MSTGMPAGIWLTKFGVILPDKKFAKLFGSDLSSGTNVKLAAITLAFATLGKEMTGLPIDFQIQQQTWANEHYPGPRSALIEIRP